MKTIISATDFSKSALNASKYAAALSAELQAELVLIHFIEIPMEPPQISLLAAEIEELEIENKKKLATIREQLLFYTENQISIRTEIVYGPADSSLNNLCAKLYPLAVIMGCRSKNKTGSAFMGDFLEKVIQNLQFPILVVFEKTAYKSLKKVGILIDESRISAEANLELLKKYLAKFNLCFQRISQPNNREQTSIKNDTDSFSGSPIFFAELSDSAGGTYEGGVTEFLEREHPDLITIISGKHKLLKHFNITGREDSIKALYQSELLLLSIPILFNQKITEDGLHPVQDINKSESLESVCCLKQDKIQNSISNYIS